MKKIISLFFILVSLESFSSSSDYFDSLAFHPNMTCAEASNGDSVYAFRLSKSRHSEYFCSNGFAESDSSSYSISCPSDNYSIPVSTELDTETNKYYYSCF